MYVCLGGDEVSAAYPAAAVESDPDSEQIRAGVAHTNEAEPGQRFSTWWFMGRSVHSL